MSPIPPRPLRVLIEDSDWIGVARVARTLPIERASERRRWETHESLLELLETWKGEPAGELTVQYAGREGCPEPARFPEGSTAIAFLERKSDRWTADSMSYASKVITCDAMKVDYAARTSEMLEILALPLPIERRQATVEWLLRCCESPHTRWEGAYDLFPGKTVRSVPEHERVGGFAKLLTTDQRGRLAEVVATCESICEPGAWGLYRALSPFHDLRIADLLLAEVRRLSTAPTYMLRPLMEELVLVLDWQEGKALLETTRFPAAFPELRAQRLSAFLDRMAEFRARR